MIGFEPTTSWSQTKRSSQAELHPGKTGYPAWTRTMNNSAKNCGVTITLQGSGGGYRARTGHL